MSTAAFIVAAVVIVAILIVAAWLYSTRQRSHTNQRSQQLRDQFGSEYDRTVTEKGDSRSAEKELTARQKRVSQLTIRPIAADEGVRFSDEWRAAQGNFVDDPSAALRDADALVGRSWTPEGTRKAISSSASPTCRSIIRQPSANTGPPMRSGSATRRVTQAPRIYVRPWSMTTRCSPSSSWTSRRSRQSPARPFRQQSRSSHSLIRPGGNGTPCPPGRSSRSGCAVATCAAGPRSLRP